MPVAIVRCTTTATKGYGRTNERTNEQFGINMVGCDIQQGMARLEFRGNGASEGGGDPLLPPPLAGSVQSGTVPPGMLHDADKPDTVYREQTKTRMQTRMRAARYFAFGTNTRYSTGPYLALWIGTGTGTRTVLVVLGILMC